MGRGDQVGSHIMARSRVADDEYFLVSVYMRRSVRFRMQNFIGKQHLISLKTLHFWKLESNQLSITNRNERLRTKGTE
jgi:hypothetical protein